MLKNLLVLLVLVAMSLAFLPSESHATVRRGLFSQRLVVRQPVQRIIVRQPVRRQAIIVQPQRFRVQQFRQPVRVQRLHSQQKIIVDSHGRLLLIR